MQQSFVCLYLSFPVYLDQDQVLKRRNRLYSKLSYTHKLEKVRKLIGERKRIYERRMDRNDLI